MQLEALQFFCHPWLKPFTAPVRHPADGLTYAASGFVALRVRRGHWFTEELPEADAEFIERVGALPWDRFEPDPKLLGSAKWRLMDDSRGTIYRDGPLDLWTTHAKPVMAPLVHVAAGPLVPLPMLQLLARLPRCEVRMMPALGPLLFRFTGGEGIVADYWREKQAPPAKFSLFKARDTSPGLLGFQP